MRFLVAAYLLFLASGLTTAPTSQNLRNRYGAPDVERFTAEGDIGLTVEYGSDGLACQIVIDRKQPLIRREQGITYMAPEVVGQIIDEIVPPAGRGSVINSMLESMGCAEGRTEEYESVWISRNSDMCVPLKPERESAARIAFKRKVCPVSLFDEMFKRVP
jgi:hypothetical protein